MPLATPATADPGAAPKAPRSAVIAPGAGPGERLAWLRLARSRRVGPATFLKLMRLHGSAGAALEALPAMAAEAGETDYRCRSAADAKAELDAGARIGARLACLGEAHYPAALAGIADPPPVLWMLGDPALAARPSVALVGARNASSMGLRMAARLARELGEAGLAIVSGLARGIDAAAHKAALETGTVAVVAGGVDVVYPPENADLARDLARAGLIVSEMPMGLQPQARHFPRRNRIVAGLSEAVIVVEAAARSGSLITAREALDQGREVMAVPGHPIDPRASGCNMLIRDGAVLVRGADDVLAALDRPVPQRKVPTAGLTARPVAGGPVPAAAMAAATAGDPPPASGAALADMVLSLLGPAPVPEDMLIRQTGQSTARVLEILAELDLEGRIERHAGGLVSRAAA